MDNSIEIKNARVNNLKGVSLSIPRDKFIVIAGVSGSGKSSLAFDTLYAEGQRRYVESLSSYARLFLGRMNKPECDYIKGLPPAIAIEQKVTSRNSRSTVGTSTEIYEYLRLLFARIGRTFSPVSGIEVRQHTTDDFVSIMQTHAEGERFVVLTPLKKPEGRSLKNHLTTKNQQGYSRLWTDGQFLRIADLLDNEEQLSTVKADDLFIVIDRMSVSREKADINRLLDTAETAFYEGDGVCYVLFTQTGQRLEFSTRFEADGITFEKPSDNMFSFNSPTGACPTCEGYGRVIGIDEKLVIPNPSLSVYDGCVQCWHGEKMGMWKDEFIRRAAIDNFPIFTPYMQLTPGQKDMLWHGLPSDKRRPSEERVSIDAFFQMVKDNQYKIQYRVMLSRFRGKTVCPDCHGTRLKPETNYVKICGKSITELVEMPVKDLKVWFDNLQLTDHEQSIARRLLIEIRSRLQFLLNVGLGYLTLNRPSNTLSGGESQRINLTTSLGSSLVGSLYILDEPSIGLHQRDTDQLIGVLRQLQEVGNTVIVVEHDEEMLRAADYLIDVGPDAGRLGGEIVFEGHSATLLQDNASLLQQHPRSHTIRYLTGADAIPTPTSRRAWNEAIIVKTACMNNLKGIDVSFPLHVFTVVSGVSGSGKSSLVKGILYPALKRHLDETCDPPGEYAGLDGDWQRVRHVEFVDQNPIGKSTRSNPVTYVKAYDAIRQLFADQQLSRQMGFTAQHFSFNTEGGRCEECKGTGITTVEMQFMADLQLVCDACHGQRFRSEVLDVKFQGHNINDVLNMTVNQAIEFFAQHSQTAIVKRLKPLQDVGLGYIKLGQSSSTLSGGENQRVKLAYFMSLERQDHTLFIFDEPTTGLHFHDIQRLLNAFEQLIDRGHTILVIEHNMDVIKSADHVIDLGPEGGDAGGNVVFAGTPEQLADCADSLTGKFLKAKLHADSNR